MERVTCLDCGTEHPNGLCPKNLLREALRPDTLLCANCGNTTSDDARFCAHCGSAVPFAAPAQDSDSLRTALEAKLRGQYRIVRLLGRGGMGSVYLARDLALDREVAIKVVNTASDSRDLHERFRREARTAASLSHPHIVPLHAFGEVERMPYFVMGYVRGESLAQRLRRDGKMPEEEARRVIGEIADALDHAHRQGVVHRDIKPDNVLLEDETGRALLTDFGVAKALGKGETLTSQGSVVGTPHFMSPEQASGAGHVDGRSDIYSLGVMAYAMLSGRLPFDGATPADVLRKHLTQDPPPLRSVAPSISDPTLQVVERCLAKDPGKRWPDARSLKTALGTVVADQLPDALESVHGQGLGFALIGGSLLRLVWLIVIRWQGGPMVILALTSSMVVITYFVVLFGLRFEGFAFGTIHRALWAEPAWWPFWYPSDFRRRGNVWDRLPVRVRRFRTFIPLYFVIFAILCLDAGRWIAVRLATFAVLGVIFFVLELMAKKELKRKGIVTAMDLNRVTFSTPPSRIAFWSRPDIAAILSPAPRADHDSRSDSPNDRLQSILRNASEMSGPLRELSAQAAAAARQVIASIDDIDREIAALARNIEPGDEERLSSKIDALAGDDSSPLRELLEKQRELIRGLSNRIEHAKETRSRRVEMLRSLALHVASLRARSGETPTAVGSLTDRVRTLCDDIAKQIATINRIDETPTVAREP